MPVRRLLLQLLVVVLLHDSSGCTRYSCCSCCLCCSFRFCYRFCSYSFCFTSCCCCSSSFSSFACWDMQGKCVPTPFCIYHVLCALLFLRHLLALFCINLISLPTRRCQPPPLPPCSSLLVTLALEVSCEWGGGRGRRKCARYQSRKSVHEANPKPNSFCYGFFASSLARTFSCSSFSSSTAVSACTR